MTYAETLSFLYSRLATFHRDGNLALNPSLDKTLALLAALGNPERSFKSIHVGGTNGKGSVSHMLTSVLMASGIRGVGLYTSPHLLDFSERIRVDGQPVAQDFVSRFVVQHEALIEQINPSFFELTTAMAFQYFKEQHVEVAVVEVGLGGRLDSTNVITPELSIITNISFDHAEILGETLARIATEKAGIFKPGVPAIVGQVTDETRAVFENVAAERGAPLTVASAHYTIARHNADWNTQALKVQHITGQTATYETDLLGDYQCDNLATVLQAVSILRANGWDIKEEAVANGLCTVKMRTGLRGRFEVLRQAPITIVDIAHNEAGIRSLMAQFAQVPAQDRHIVFGVVQEKDLRKILPLLPHDDTTYYFVKPNIPRGLDERALQDAAEQHGLIGAYYPSVAAGLKAARAFAAPEDAILITGSTFVVAEAMEQLTVNS